MKKIRSPAKTLLRGGDWPRHLHAPRSRCLGPGTQAVWPDKDMYSFHSKIHSGPLASELWPGALSCEVRGQKWPEEALCS